MGKVNSHNKGKVWENTNIPKLRVFQRFCAKQKSMRFPKLGMSEFPQYGKSMLKNKHSKIMDSKIFHMKQKSIRFPNHGMNKFPYYGISTGKHRQLPGSALLNRFRVMETHIIPNFPNFDI